MKLGKVEIIFLALIIEYAQQPPIQRNEINLRSASANIKDAVMKLLPCLFTGQAVGRQPDPGRGEIPAPVLVGIAVGFFRRDGILPAVKNDRPTVGALHAFRVPIHSEGFGVPQGLAGPIAHVEGDLFVDCQVPGHFACVTHPFRMGSSLVRCDGHAASERCFTGQAIRRLDLIRRIPIQMNVLPGKEAVQLAGIIAPGACLDHEVGWFLSRGLVLRELSQDGLILRHGRITDKEFNKERLILTGFRILCGKGMPPPVVAVMGQWAVEHECVAGDIVMIKHGSWCFLSVNSD